MCELDNTNCYEFYQTVCHLSLNYSYTNSSILFHMVLHIGTGSVCGMFVTVPAHVNTYAQIH